MVRLRLATLTLTPLVAPASLVRTTVRGRVYWRLHLRLPTQLAGELLGGGGRRGYAVALVARATHLHLQYWDDSGDPLWRALPEAYRRELEILGLTEWSPDEVILIPATPGELRELGLNPGKPLTLRDIVEAARRRAQPEARRQTSS